MSAASNQVVWQVEGADLFGAYDTAAALVDRRPDSAEALFARSYVYRYAGLLDEAMADCDSALALDPKNEGLRSCSLAFLHAQRHERAMTFLDLTLGSDFYFDALAHLELGRGQPEAALQSWGRVSAEYTFHEGELLRACLEASPRLLDISREDEAVYDTVRDPETLYFAGSEQAFCGQKDSALRLLRRAIARGHCSYPALDNDRSWDSLREDPDFLALREEAIACRERFLDHIEEQADSGRCSVVHFWPRRRPGSSYPGRAADRGDVAQVLTQLGHWTPRRLVRMARSSAALTGHWYRRLQSVRGQE